MNIKIIIFWSLLFISNVSFTQEKGFVVPDSLKEKSFKELKGKIIKNKKSKYYASLYLKKAKIEKDTLEIVHGYHFLSYLNKDKIKLLYLDSLIKISSNKNFNNYPEKGFLEKGDYYYNKRDFQNALANYILGEKTINKIPIDQSFLKAVFYHRIGIIKSRIGDKNGALKLFKKSWLFYNKENNNIKYKNEYVTLLFALSTSLSENKEFVEATQMNKLGFQVSKNIKTKGSSYFTLLEGVNQYYLNNLKISEDSLKLSIKNQKINKNIPNLIINYFYLGNIYKSKNKNKKSIYNYKKIDSLLSITNDIHPDVREAFVYLKNYYKSKNNYQKQLYYTNRLAYVDSLINTNYKILKNKLTDKFDIPNLLSKNDKKIIELKNKNKKQYKNILLMLIVVLVLSYFLSQLSESIDLLNA